MPTNAHETHARLIAKLLRDVVQRDRFDTLADVVDALKTRCSRARIPWTNDDINDALRLVGSNVRLTAGAPPLPRVGVDRGAGAFDADHGLTRHAAAAALARVATRLRLPGWLFR